MKPPHPDLPEFASLDPEAAAALDAVLDDLQSGRPVDRKALLAHHPQLDGALAALNHLFPEPVTVAEYSATVSLGARPDQIGPYRIESELGQGGFGVVYLGFDPQVKRRVAVKLLHSGRLD